jgi:hypothetical protein
MARRWEGSGRGLALGSASLGDVLAPARSGDVDADGVHGEAVEDRGGQAGVAEVAAPVDLDEGLEPEEAAGGAWNSLYLPATRSECT